MNMRNLAALTLAATVAASLGACGDKPAPSAEKPAASAESPAASAPSPSLTAAPETRMITNDGHRLAFHVTAGHAPVIVLDAGGGEDSSYWDELVPRLAKATGSEIVTYDRAGLGDSDEVPGAWNPQAAVSDLRAGLTELGVTRDVVLVSHSQAGEVATYLAGADPALFKRAVLVDANLPGFFTDAEIARLVAANAPQIEALKAQPSTKANRQLIATATNFAETHHAYHQAAWPDAVPATYIVSEKTPFDGSPEDAQRWRDAAAAFAKAGPGRTLVTATGSSHDVPKDQPDLVLAEISKAVSG